MSYLKSLLTIVFMETYYISDNKNPTSIFLIGFTQSQLNSIERETTDSLSEINRVYRVIDCENLAEKEIVDVINKKYSYSMEEALENLQSTFKNDQIVYIIKNLSKSRIVEDKGLFARNMMDTLQKCTKNSLSSRTDMIYIDYASFLEKNWDILGNHIIYNYLTKSDELQQLLTKNIPICVN